MLKDDVDSYFLAVRSLISLKKQPPSRKRDELITEISKFLGPTQENVDTAEDAVSINWKQWSLFLERRFLTSDEMFDKVFQEFKALPK